MRETLQVGMAGGSGWVSSELWPVPSVWFFFEKIWLWSPRWRNKLDINTTTNITCTDIALMSLWQHISNPNTRSVWSGELSYTWVICVLTFKWFSKDHKLFISYAKDNNGRRPGEHPKMEKPRTRGGPKYKGIGVEAPTRKFRILQNPV